MIPVETTRKMDNNKVEHNNKPELVRLEHTSLSGRRLPWELVACWLTQSGFDRFGVGCKAVSCQPCSN
jgi:hypothetical protein